MCSLLRTAYVEEYLNCLTILIDIFIVLESNTMRNVVKSDRYFQYTRLLLATHVIDLCCEGY